MALFFHERHDEPGTHALLIGVGGYPGVSELDFATPRRSVALLRDWLMATFNNPQAPFASLEMLRSGPSPDRADTPLGLIEEKMGEPDDLLPTSGQIIRAVEAWRSRVARHNANVGIVYFASFACETKHGTTLLTDEANESPAAGAGSILLDDLKAGLFQGKTGRVACFLETYHLSDALLKRLGLAGLTREPPPALFPSARIDPSRPRLLVHVSSQPIVDPSYDPKPLLVPALTALLDNPQWGTQAITIRGLQSGIAASLKHVADNIGLSSAQRPLGQKTEAESEFQVHVPRSATESADGGVEGADMGPETPPATDTQAIAEPDPAQTRTATAIAAQGKLAETQTGTVAAIAAQGERAETPTGSATRGQAGATGAAAKTGAANRTTARKPSAKGEKARFAALLEEPRVTKAELKTAIEPPTSRPGVRDRSRSAPAPAPAPPVATPLEKPTPEQPAEESDKTQPEPNTTEFVADDAETERDELGRGVLAVALARRLHKIWRKANGVADPGPAGEIRAAAAPDAERPDDSRAAFVVHLDAPWGGGKTTFANFLARVLNPYPAGAGRAALFLRADYGEAADFGGVFLAPPPADQSARQTWAAYPEEARRPWIVIPFNAWQAEHLAPPWWAFYQAIRRGCFEAIRTEGDEPWQPRPRLPVWLRRARSRLRGFDRWLDLWLHEYVWRLLNPKIRALLVTAATGSALLAFLYWRGYFGITGEHSDSAGFILTSGVGLFAAGLTGISAIWGFGAVLTESIMPGTDTLAERLSLGAGDPFDRFRAHFRDMMRRVQRPVMVIIDDLDRCRPEFVVDLVRGIQTLLRSPRVVFVILGDRDWIERAFEAHHRAMSKIDVGPEQSFGARFVEKAIQMSFILPGLGQDSRGAYVRRVLMGAQGGAAQPNQSLPPQRRVEARTVAAQEIARQAAQPVPATGAPPALDTASIVNLTMQALNLVPPAAAGETRAASDAAAAEQVEQIVNEELAINAAVDARVESAVGHELEKLAAFFPANPRQIKRIVNAITMYYAVALQRPGVEPNHDFRFQLALWVIIMTEWPRTWRLLASYPDMVLVLTAANPNQEARRADLDLPGSINVTQRLTERIMEDTDLSQLITGKSPHRGKSEAEAARLHVGLDSATVRILVELTPLHSRKRRLPDETPEPAQRDGAVPAAARAAAGGGKKTSPAKRAKTGKSGRAP